MEVCKTQAERDARQQEEIDREYEQSLQDGTEGEEFEELTGWTD